MERGRQGAAGRAACSHVGSRAEGKREVAGIPAMLYALRTETTPTEHSIEEEVCAKRGRGCLWRVDCLRSCPRGCAGSTAACSVRRHSAVVSPSSWRTEWFRTEPARPTSSWRCFLRCLPIVKWIYSQLITHVLGSTMDSRRHATGSSGAGRERRGGKERSATGRNETRRDGTRRGGARPDAARWGGQDGTGRQGRGGAR